MIPIKYEFSYKLNEGDLLIIKHFYQAQTSVFIEQLPGWFSVIYPERKILHFVAKKNEQVIAYAGILHQFGKIASIPFGPIVNDVHDWVSIVEEIYNYHKRKKFFVLTIQPGIIQSEETDKIIQILRQKVSFIQKNDQNDWSSIRIDLKEKEEIIFSKFSKNHQRAIRKAQKVGLKAEMIQLEEIDDFALQYIQMYKHRKLAIDQKNYPQVIKNMFLFLKESKCGYFLGIKNAENQLIGGLIIVFQGNSAFYAKGYSHPDFRNFPVTHFAFYEAIIIARAAGLSFFDFGGYNHFAEEADQVFNINLFKKGFGGEFVFYPPQLYFTLNKMGYWLYNSLKKARKLIS